MQAAPAQGCAFWEREVGADDEAHAPEPVPTLVLGRWLGWPRTEQL